MSSNFEILPMSGRNVENLTFFVRNRLHGPQIGKHPVDRGSFEGT